MAKEIIFQSPALTKAWDNLKEGDTFFILIPLTIMPRSITWISLRTVRSGGMIILI